LNSEAIHQSIDQLTGIVLGVAGEMGVFCGGKNTDMTKNLLQFDQVNASF